MIYNNITYQYKITYLCVHRNYNNYTKFIHIYTKLHSFVQVDLQLPLNSRTLIYDYNNNYVCFTVYPTSSHWPILLVPHRISEYCKKE